MNTVSNQVLTQVGGVVEHMCNSVLAAHGLLWTDGAQEIVELLG